MGNPRYRKNLHGFGSAKAGFCLKCGAWRGSLGLEPTFELYIKHLCDIFDEIKKVLRKDGTCFINIGDSYGGSGNASGHTKDTKNLGYKTLEMGATQGNQRTTGQYAKSLLDIPYRFSIEMINRGWIKRNTIIWWKPGCMPSSADDRFTVDFEYFFYFVKNNKTIFWTNEKTLECVDKKPLGNKGIEGKDWEWRNHKKVSLWRGHDYWFEQQFQPIAEATIKRSKNKFYPDNPKTKLWYSTQKAIKPGRDAQTFNREVYKKIASGEKTTANMRCVWIIPTQPFPEAHFAVYPEGLIEIPIKAGCPEFVCKKCGRARVKTYKKIGIGLSATNGRGGKAGEHFHPRDYIKARQAYKGAGFSKIIKEEIGYTDCGCNASFEGGIVLDPFMGAGTTALVALKQRKRFIGIEIKQEYIDMANRRIAKVQQEIF